MPHTHKYEMRMCFSLLEAAGLSGSQLTITALPPSCAENPSTGDGLNDAGNPVTTSRTGPHHPPNDLWRTAPTVRRYS